MRRALITADSVPIGLPAASVLDSVRSKLGGTRGYGVRYHGQWLLLPAAKKAAALALVNSYSVDTARKGGGDI